MATTNRLDLKLKRPWMNESEKCQGGITYYAAYRSSITRAKPSTAGNYLAQVVPISFICLPFLVAHSLHRLSMHTLAVLIY